MHGGDRYKNTVKLDFSININPLGMPKQVKQAIYHGIAEMEYYPDPSCERLKRKIAKKRKVSEWNIILGNGACELIYAVIRAIAPSHVWIPIPSFTEYERALWNTNAKITWFPLKKEQDFCIGNELSQAILEAVNQPGKKQIPDLIVLCNPNNPNGKLIPHSIQKELMELCKKYGIYLLIDECFLELSGKLDRSAAANISENPYIFVLDAFTKTYAMPGIRLGVGYSSNRALLETMQLQLPQWNVSGIAQIAGLKALEEEAYVKEAVALIKTERRWLMDELKQLNCNVFSSDANYVLFQSVKDWKQLLLKSQILIRDCQNYRGLTKGFYRVAVQTREKNQQLIEAMRKE